MRLIDRTPKISRRTLLRTGSVTAAAAMAPAAAVTGKVWAAEPVAVSADTHATLVRMARDIYPHDKLSDQYYATVIDGLDAAARDDAAAKEMLEKGVAQLDGLSERMGHGKYAASDKEEDRVAVLKEIEKQDAAFFNKIRGSLVTGIYNNPEVWPIFGYEGESASQGGYISRGFDDINWLT
jgi:Pyruvate/2-oxoacid:ferredoxin oxidoreductase gamma subunit